MSYTDDSAARTQDTEGTLKTFHLLLKGGEVYQVVMPPDADGDWSNTSGGLVEAHSAVASATSVYEVRCNLDDAAAANYWMCIVDKATAPANSDVVIDAVKVTIGGTSTITFPGGRPLTNGLALCISSTLDTVTLPGDSNAKFSWNAD